MHVLVRARRRMAVAATMVLALLIGGVVAAPSAMATFPGYEGKIAFQRIDSTSGPTLVHVWTVNPDGSDLRQLTTGSSQNQYPTWSPDGQKLAFSSNRDGNLEIYVMNADGSSQTRITTSPRRESQPSWSPDGTTLIYWSWSGISGEPQQIRAINIATKQETIIVPDLGGVGRLPEVGYSPDGNFIAWQMEKNIPQPDGTFNGYARLMLANADGTNARVLKERTITGEECCVAAWHLSWNVDSQSINWRSSYPEGVHHRVVGSRIAIDDVGTVLYEKVGGSNPDEWVSSPTGQRLVTINSNDVVLADLEGNMLRKLTDTQDTIHISDSHPEWQPSSVYIDWDPAPSDTTKPTISITSPTEGQQVTQGDSLTANYACSDGGSGVQSCEGTVPNGSAIDTSTVGIKTFTVTATDVAGNTHTETVTYTVVTPPDTTKPTISITSPTEGQQVTQGDSLTANYACSDGGSGVQSCEGTVPNGSAIDTSTVGTKTFTVTATDVAGNTHTETVTYTVVWPFGGFSGSIASPPFLNSAKAGGVVPVSFSLGGYRGMDIFAAGYPKSVNISCSTLEATSPSDEASTSSPGKNVLSYDSTIDHYTYNWKMEKSWLGSCRQFVVKLNDGNTLRANFQFK